MVAGSSETVIRPADTSVAEFGPWNPGIVSQLPAELRHLCTVFRPENVSTSLSAATELQLLTGLPAAELVAFRPQRLVLHEVLIRVMAEFSVPDGSRIEDLGINFRQITSLLIGRYLEPQMPEITAAFAHARSRVAEAIHSAFADLGPAPAHVPAGRPPLLRLWSRRRSPSQLAADPAPWGLARLPPVSAARAPPTMHCKRPPFAVSRRSCQRSLPRTAAPGVRAS